MTNTDRFTIGDIMGRDHEVYVKKNAKFGVDIVIQDEDQNIILDETIHRFAAESMADFCRQYLHFYDKMVAHNELTSVA